MLECETLSDCVVRQYRACVVDLLGLGFHMCSVFYSVCTNHPDSICLLVVPSLYSTVRTFCLLIAIYTIICPCSSFY